MVETIFDIDLNEVVCPICGTEVPQHTNECPSCKVTLEHRGVSSKKSLHGL